MGEDLTGLTTPSDTSIKYTVNSWLLTRIQQECQQKKWNLVTLWFTQLLLPQPNQPEQF